MMQHFTYQLNYDELSYTVTSYTGNDDEIIIPECFGGKPMTILFDKLVAGHSEIRSVLLPDMITDLGEFLFDGCNELRHLELPAELKFLWGYTFVRCGLEEIIIPDGVTSIPPYAFKDCKNLQKVVFGTGLKKIYDWAFGGCDKLTEVVYKTNVDISPHAFGTNENILVI